MNPIGNRLLFRRILCGLLFATNETPQIAGFFVFIIMNTTEILALTACIISAVALIPQFKKSFRRKRKIATNKENNKEKNIGNSEIDEKKESTEKTLDPLQKAFILCILAAIVGVVEVIIFSWIAHAFGVEMNLKTMPSNWIWAAGFLLLIPGVLLLYAILFITSVMED